VGPVWGSASLQRFGASMPFLWAAAFLVLTFAITVGYRGGEAEALPSGS